MKTTPLPSQHELNSLLTYDPETGKLTWRERDIKRFKSDHHGRTWNTQFANKEAFTYIDSVGYRQGAICGQSYRAHRVIWKIVYGTEPIQIDHQDGDRANNRIDNLRNVSIGENRKNAGLRSDNTSGVHGVSRIKATGRYRARINVDGVEVFLGNFDTQDEAVAVRLAAEPRYGFHKNHGRAA